MLPMLAHYCRLAYLSACKSLKIGIAVPSRPKNGVIGNFDSSGCRMYRDCRKHRLCGSLVIESGRRANAGANPAVQSERRGWRRLSKTSRLSEVSENNDFRGIVLQPSRRGARGLEIAYKSGSIADMSAKRIALLFFVCVGIFFASFILIALAYSAVISGRWVEEGIVPRYSSSLVAGVSSLVIAVAATVLLRNSERLG